MPQKKHLGDYGVEMPAILDKALVVPEGVKLSLARQDDANSLRMKFYGLRKADKRHSRSAYPSADPRYGRSDWDELSFVVKQDGERWILHIGKNLSVVGDITVLDEAGNPSSLADFLAKI